MIAVNWSKFWSWVKLGNVTECWPWLASTDSRGYCRMRVNGRLAGAHRIALMFAQCDLVSVAHHSAKLDPEKVLKIRSDHRSIRTIAAEYGLAYSTIREIKIRKTWKHIK